MRTPNRPGNYLPHLSLGLDDPSLCTVGGTAALPRLTWLEFFMERDFEKKFQSSKTVQINLGLRYQECMPTGCLQRGLKEN